MPRKSDAVFLLFRLLIAYFQLGVHTSWADKLNIKSVLIPRPDQNQTNELRRVDLSHSGLISSKNICTFCSVDTKMSVNMSCNEIMMLDEVECNCSGVTEIDFSNNNLTVLRANSFTFVQSVRIIYMAGNHIHQLDQHAFNGLQFLEMLDLSRNSLRVIHLNSFSGLIHLCQLNLSANGIEHIVSEELDTLKTLEVLDLSANNIHTLDRETFKSAMNLLDLNLDENKLSNPILNFLSPFLNLSVMRLRGNNFTSFDNGSFNGYSVCSIILSRLPFLRYILNGAFTNTTALSSIDLSDNNNLVFIEYSAFENLPNLITLEINGSKLKASSGISNDVESTCNCAGLCGDYTIQMSTNRSLCLSNDMHFTHNTSCPYCGPYIVSDIADEYTVFIGQRLNLDCFATGQPKPHVRWERIHIFPNGTVTSLELLTDGYFLHMNILSLNMKGKYRCSADINGTLDSRYFNIIVRQLDIGIRVLSRNSHSVLITWNMTHHVTRHVILYRAFETTLNYVTQRLNNYWKLFLISSLTPYTEYEICIASFTDTNDKTCLRTMTTTLEPKRTGIHHNKLAIAVLVISGIVFGVFVVTTVYRCAHKVHEITKRNVFIVSSESRECFADVTESTFTYENQHTNEIGD